MKLPLEFTRRMEKMLGEESSAFLSSLEKEKAYGLRLNPLKDGGFLSPAHLPFTLSPVPWAKEGFFAKAEEHPGRHPLHEAGAYYIQEPSAMAVATLLDPQPGDIICDFCAAPGGKSTGIAGRMAGRGLLVSNEIFPARAKILSQNMERLGIPNCVVTNEPPEKMSRFFPGFFDKILVDAPCSGEGMFRKDSQAIAEWKPSLAEFCRDRQEMILEEAEKMLRPGGILVYSTCTFAPEENESQIAHFLQQHPDYILEDWRDFLPNDCGLEGGRTWTLPSHSANGRDSQLECPDAEKALRLWPHRLQGEGHFAARLRKNGAPVSTKQKKNKKKSSKKTENFKTFYKDFLTLDSGIGSVSAAFHEKGHLHAFGEELYLVPPAMKSLSGIKVLRAGLQLGSEKKNRFHPSHALAMALLPQEAVQVHECDDESILAYLRGESLPCDANLRSWTLVTYQGFSIGWGKASQETLKNHYPKGLRLY